MSQKPYVCFLRAINVGGNNIIKMDDLKKVFESIGCIKVDTYIQTGNVFFKSAASEKTLKSKIEKAIEQQLKKDIEVSVLSFSRLQQLLQKNPANKKPYTNAFKIYVGFFMDKLSRKPKLPISTPDGAYELVYPDTELVILVRHTQKGNYSQYKKLTEKTLPTTITLRTFGVVEKMIQKWEDKTS